MKIGREFPKYVACTYILERITEVAAGEVKVDAAARWALETFAALCECVEMPRKAYSCVVHQAANTDTATAGGGVVDDDKDSAAVAAWRVEIGLPPTGKVHSTDSTQLT